jgi:hypothetical protein
MEKIWYIWHFYIYPIIIFESPGSPWGLKLRAEKLDYDAAQKKKPKTNRDAILKAAQSLHNSGVIEYSGYQISLEIQKLERTHFGIGLGTLYNNLYELENNGILFSRWIESTNPRRRLYTLNKPENKRIWVPDTAQD